MTAHPCMSERKIPLGVLYFYRLANVGIRVSIGILVIVIKKGRTIFDPALLFDLET